MKAKLREDIVNKHKEARKIEVPLSEGERREWVRTHKRGERPPEFKFIKDLVYYGKNGETLDVFDGDMRGFSYDDIDILILVNKAGERFSVRRELIELIKN